MRAKTVSHVKSSGETFFFFFPVSLKAVIIFSLSFPFFFLCSATLERLADKDLSRFYNDPQASPDTVHIEMDGEVVYGGGKEECSRKEIHWE